MRSIKNISILVFLISLVVAGCVTTKKKGDVSKFKRGYNSLTEHYNYWFNSNEILRLKEVELAKGLKDNYNQILPIYPEMVADPTPIKKDFESAEKKAAMGIGLHTVGTWTDDCYLLMGQAQFYRRDYETAEATFSYLKDEYNPNKTAKSKLKKSSSKKKASAKKKSSAKKKKAAAKKKKASAKKKKAAKKKAAKKKAAAKKKGDSKDSGATKDASKEDANKPTKQEESEEEQLELIGQNPYRQNRRVAAYPEAMIWYGRTLAEREKYEEAEFVYRELWEDKWFPRHLRDDLAKAEAHLWIKQKQYGKAGSALERAVKFTEKKKDRARLAFIQAQLYERFGDTEKAYAALETVLNSKPNYELEFNARLNQVLDGWHAATIKSAEANKRLERMIKDGKNKEYLDKIYYALGEIALEDGLKKDAIGFYRSSLDHSLGDAGQKAESYYRLATLYFDREEFVLAKAYYDSTLTVFDVKDERYPQVSQYAANLTEIARLITTITNNDSIVRVYNMSEAERVELAKKIKKERDELAAKQALEAEKNKDAVAADKKPPVANAGAKPSTFYFYSEAAVKKGKRDFERTWGERKLEDNWRRSQRISSGGGPDEVAAEQDNTDKSKQTEDTSLADIFKDLPRSEAELAVIHLATYEAMYKLGTLFRDKLENDRRCVSTLEEMQDRYPDTLRYEKETWYYCYLSHTDLENAARAKYYLDKLVEKYPNSPFTRALTDPNFLNAGKEKEKELNAYYELTYNTFKKGDYKTAFYRCEDAPKKYGSTNPIMAKFALLGALCLGSLQGNDSYCQALNDVVGRFPNSAEATRAKEIARLLSCKGYEAGGTASKQVDDAFEVEEDKLHYLLILFTEGDIKLESIKNAVSDYNRENHRTEQLRLSNIYLGSTQDQPILVIRKFDNKEKGMKYLNEVKSKRDFLGETAKVSYEKEFYLITQENYRRILKNKTIDGYREFFEENYLK
ncbi:MAG: tetratricopeptide repeat protein [Chitinophagales bacterium]